MTERATAGDAFGRLVATSSLASLFGTARNEHYAATKAAINALVRALAVELARQGVTSNAILPGWIKSDMTAGIMANEKFVGQRDAAHPDAPVRRAQRFRRHRGLSDEQGVVVSHRRLFRDRWRLHGVLMRSGRRDPYALPLVLRDAVGCLRRKTTPCGYGYPRARGRGVVSGVRGKLFQPSLPRQTQSVCARERSEAIHRDG